MPKFRCEHCNQKIAAPDAYVGRRVRCPRCKQPSRVPEAVAPAATVAPPTFSEASEFEPLVAHAAAPAASPAIEENQPSSVESVGTPPVEEDPAALFSEWLSGPAAREPSQEDHIDQGPSQPHDHSHVAPPQEHYQPAVDDQHPQSEAQDPAEAPAEIVVPSSEVIDQPRRRRKRQNSTAEVADLLQTLRQREEVAEERPVVTFSRPADVAWDDGSDLSGMRALGWASLGIGVVAIAMACVPVTLPYAVPAGSAGLLLALTGIFLATGRRTRRIHVLVAGLTASTMAIAAPILGAFGVLPVGAKNAIPHAGSTPSVNVTATGAGTGTTNPGGSDSYISATSPTILNHVEIRVASAQVLQPAVYAGDYDSLLTMSERRMQITLELRDLGSDPVTYEPWRKGDATGDDAKLTDADGNALTIDISPNKPDVPATLPIGSLKGSTPLVPGGPAAADVLLFEPPENPHEDLKLDLPGANLGAPNAIVHIRIPAAMVQAD